MAVGDILENYGFQVFYTRTEDVYQRPYQKATITNEIGGDLFVSIHRNSSPVPNQYNGVETLVYSNQGLPKRVAENINRQLEAVGYKNLGVEERPGLIVLNSTQMPAVLVESGFINTDTDNAIYDTQFRQIAEQIADAIISMQQDFERKGNYRVQIGLYRMFSNAQYALMQAISKGFNGEIVSQGEYYAVLVGNTDSYAKAQELERQLQQAGFDTLIITSR